jgi:electron transfer flavoprotein alpha subunit
VLVENTTAGLDVAAGAAMAAGLPLVSYCTGVRLEDRAVVSTSEVYGGQLVATVRTPLPGVFAVSGDALPREPVARGRGERVAMAPPAVLDALRTRFVEDMTPAAGDVDISRVARLVAVGRGIGGANNLKVAEDLAAALGAELAASRPVVDAGWLPRARQVGKSGVAVKPRLYLALGISGAPEHLEGMRESELIVAINTDAHAAIFNVAHYGAVADLFDVAEELTKLAGPSG